MSVTRVHGASTSTAKLTGTAAPRSPSAPFQVRGTERPADVARVSSLDAFRQGQITKDHYIDAKVAHAMEHVQGLPAKQRAVIADELRTRLVSGELAHLLAGVCP